MLQHGAYTLLIDSCYDREVFPTLEQALEWTWASTDSEIDAVKFVLSRFFVLDENNQYVQDRISEELLTYHKNAVTNKRIADEREAKRKEERTKRVPSVNEPPPNHKPLTINQEPLTNINTPPVGVSQSVWQDFVSHRKANKASITQTALSRINTEAQKAGWTLEQALVECVARGWKGFKAEWVKDDKLSKTGQMNQSVLSGLTRGLVSGGSNVKFLE